MKPPISYFGSKSRLAPWIVQMFPAHRVYVEPFAGSGAVLFAKPPSTHEILNDVDDLLVNFLRVLRDRPDDLEVACRSTPYSRVEFEACADIAVAVDDLERARRWWVRSSQSFGQVATTATGWSVSIQRGSNNARSVWNRLGRFAEAAQRLGTVVVENRDALEIVEQFDAADGVIYCDPPYLGETRTSMRDGRRPGGDYRHEFDTPEQHEQLAARLRAAKAAVFVSGYPSDLYEDLYAGWSKVERRVLRRVSNGRSGRQYHATEVIWSNQAINDRLDLWGASQATDDDLRPGFAWRCLDCTWRSRARGAVAYEQVRTHQTVTGHALSCDEVLAP